jgi:ubiquitin-like modifier-activating enzyme ATG7
VQLAEQAVDLTLMHCSPACDICYVLDCRRVDVSSLMSPVQLAEQAVDLNLKLMRWRAAPDLGIAGMAATRCLLLGKWFCL